MAMPTHAPPFKHLPGRARGVVLATMAAATLGVVVAHALAGHALDVRVLVIAAVLCAAGGLFEFVAPGHYSLQPTLVFFFWGALLLPPWAVGLLAVLSYLPAALKRRQHAWYVIGFNIGNYVVAGLAAHVLVDWAGRDVATLKSSVGVIAIAAVVFVCINHLLIAVAAASSGRQVKGGASGLVIDLALAATGACLAVMWTESPATVALAIGPVGLVTAALWVPMLRHELRIDAKTGLFHSEHFARRLEDLLEEARKRDTPLALVMFDLDHLRAVNNRFGHLAGDQLIAAAADALVEAAGRDGVASRFGGEEFSLLLPATHASRAREIAEIVRARVEAVDVRDEAGVAVPASISAGVAAFPEHGDLPGVLMRAADDALYDAKLGGRNRVRVALPPGRRAAFGLERRESPVTPPPTVPVVPTQQVAADVAGDILSATAVEAAAQPVVEAPPASRRLVPWYAGLLALAAMTVGFLSDTSPVTEQPLLFGVLIVLFIGLDLIRLDLFERANTSPASLPVLAIASLFGPVGVLLAEAAIVIVRMIQRTPPVKSLFDFGALGLAGAAAAFTFDALPGDGAALVIAGVAAGFAYYAVNIPLLAIVIGLNRGNSPLDNWREQLAWLAPHYAAFGALGALLVLAERDMGLDAVAMFGIPAAVMWIAEKQYVDRSRASVEELRRSNGELEAANTRLRSLLSDNERLLSRIHQSYLSTITSLARTIEAKDPYTGGHTERVSELSAAIAAELGFSGEDLRAIEVGAVIHDIGKIGVPDSILLKPGPLTPEERAEMESHVEISSYIVADLELPSIVKQMVRGHHERFDGGGYPDGLNAHEIPLAARILSVADALDAMTTDRPYRRALKLTVALDALWDNSGTQFCPTVVQALVRCLERDPALVAELTERATAEPAAASEEGFGATTVKFSANRGE
jgi:diguanylate cyclase (GGDEF)-like protein/putative nucleotidyltransferase with HDIG domain